MLSPIIASLDGFGTIRWHRDIFSRVSIEWETGSMEDIETFLAVIEAGSQTAAARRLGRSLQSVNRSLAALERSVGVELVRRTTRQSFATEAGLAFDRRVKPAAAAISEARLEAANRRAEPSGLIRIAAPVLFGSTYVVPVVADFIARYPR